MPSNTLTLRDREVPDDRAFDISKRDEGFMLATGPVSSLGETKRMYRVEIDKENAHALVDWLMEWLNSPLWERAPHPDFPDFPGPQHA